MEAITQSLLNIFTTAIQNAFPGVQDTAIIATTTNDSFGDFQCNSPMSIYKSYGKHFGLSNPRAAAEAIRQNLPVNDLVGKVDIAGPGFLNVFLNPNFIKTKLVDMLQNGIRLPVGEKKRVIVDFSSPNIAKEMHVGHLRSTIIGDAICRILEFCGHDVDRVNHVGDWGTQFGMLIAHLQDQFPDFLTNPPDLKDLCTFYKESKKRFDSEPEFKSKAHQNVVKLQGGDEVCRTAWKLMCEISRSEFQKIYDRLQVVLEEKGESFYNPLIPRLVKELEERELIRLDGGAKCFFIPDQKIPLIAVKSDGGFSYDSTDLAGIYYRLMDQRADWVIYITDAGQWPHFELVFEAAKLAGWHRPPQTRVDHVGFGVVTGEDRKKLKTRSGDAVRLVDLLDEAKDRSLKEMKDRIASGEEKSELTEEQLSMAAEKVGYGAVKYYDLKQNRTTSYAFSFDRMLDVRGNSAVYMMYAYARIASIGRKANVEIGGLIQDAAQLVNLDDPAERALAATLLRFPDIIFAILGDLMLNRLCDFLYELAGKYNQFHHNCMVIGHEKQSSRLLLCEATRMVMLQGLQLLGITPLERL
eukprot:GILJ01001750.1.p1 GENE.GILJ01001750.1~~GILJ01001750.1.p1  ORF type:complete len:600 (+),score=136.22 GILJ01001750.1:55-1800(+)